MELTETQEAALCKLLSQVSQGELESKGLRKNERLSLLHLYVDLIDKHEPRTYSDVSDNG